MEIPVYASTSAFVTRANGRNFHLIPRIAPLLDCDGLEFMMYESWAGQEAEIAAELRDSGVRFPSMHLDKRIGELRSIEQWLTINQNMLRTTIQGLEVQRGTIAALRSFSDAVSAPRGAARDPRDLATLFAAALGHLYLSTRRAQKISGSTAAAMNTIAR